MRALVIYTSLEGQSEKIADYLAQQLSANGVPADTYNVVKNSHEEIVIESYDAVLVGSSMHYGHYDYRIRRLIRDNQTILQKLPTAFFSVSLGIQSEHLGDQHEVVKLTEEFLAELEFDPDATVYFAGALRYSKYGWLKKRMMRWIAGKSGEDDQDLGSDHEYTDWSKVDQFARHFCDGLKGNVTSGETISGDATDQTKLTLHRKSTRVFVLA